MLRQSVQRHDFARGGGLALDNAVSCAARLPSLMLPVPRPKPRSALGMPRPISNAIQQAYFHDPKIPSCQREIPTSEKNAENIGTACDVDSAARLGAAGLLSDVVTITIYQCCRDLDG